MKLVEPSAGVVEDPIQHHADAAGVDCVQHLAKRLVPAQDGIHLVVVVGVVAVVGRRLKDGVEVDSGDPQFLQIAQSLSHAQQIAPFEAVGRRRTVPRLQVRRLGNPLTAGKAIGKDLVEDSVFDPVGGNDVCQYPISNI